MEEHLNTPRRTPPLNDPLVNDPLATDTRARRHLDDDQTTYWPFVAIGAALLAGILFFGSMADKPNTQVGQQTERPAVTTQTPAKPLPQ
jgi:hypothetical protein